MLPWVEVRFPTGVIAGAVVVCLASASVPAQPLGSVPVQTPVADDAWVSVPALFAFDVPCVEARVGGRGPFYVGIDTGVATSCIDESLARGRTEAGQPVPAEAGPLAVAPVSVELGGISLVLPAPRVYALSDQYSAVLGRPLVGFLGGDLFKDYVIEIDYLAQTVRLRRASGFVYEGPGEVLPLNLRGCPGVTVTLAQDRGDPVTTELMLDTGAGWSLLLSRGFARAKTLIGTDTPAVPVPFAGIEGIGKGTQITVRQLRAGGFGLERVPTVITPDERGFSRFSPFDGALGSEAFADCRLLIDYRGHRAIVERLAPPVPERPGRFGFTPVKSFGGLSVESVDPGSVADTAGLRAGDLVLEIGGRSVKACNWHTVRRLLTPEGAGSVTLRVQRSEGEAHIVLPMPADPNAQRP